MGLLDFFKKKEQPAKTKKSNVLLAMPMFNNGEVFELKKVIDELKNTWNTTVTDIQGELETVTFQIQGELVALSWIPAQIPFADIQGTAQYAYNWQTAESDLENHNSHVIVTVMSNTKSEIEQFSILTKVLSSIIATTNCLGIYQGSQSLLIPRQQYLDSADALKSNQIPLDLWVYIGLRQGENGNTAYTYGLTAFDKLEMEFINAKLDLEEMHNFLLNICNYIITNDVTFKSGETLGYTADQKIKITKSKGQFVEGETLKLEL